MAQKHRKNRGKIVFAGLYLILSDSMQINMSFVGYIVFTNSKKPSHVPEHVTCYLIISVRKVTVQIRHLSYLYVISHATLDGGRIPAYSAVINNVGLRA